MPNNRTYRALDSFDVEENDLDIDQPRAKLLGHEGSSVVSLEMEDVPSMDASSILRPPTLTMMSVLAMVIGSAIGSGIFASTSRVDNDVPSPGVAILVWVLAGIIAWTGATSFAELGAAIPKNGGMQEYLRYIYGDMLASLMSWMWIMAVKGSAVAIISIIFSEYWMSIINPSNSGPWWHTKLLAMVTVGFVLLVNCLSANISTRFTNALMYSKLSTVVFILIIAVLVATFGLDNTGNPNKEWKERSWFENRSQNADGTRVNWTMMGSWEFFGRLTSALYAALWACGGWDNANLVVAEMRNPSRDLPRVVNFSIPIVMACFILTNVSYYIILPRNVLQGSDAIAVAVGRKALGPAGAIIFVVLVSASCLGVLNIDIYSGGILTETAAQHGYLPRFLARPSSDDASTYRDQQGREREKPTGRLHRLKRMVVDAFMSPTSTIPRKAMIFNVSISVPYILLGSFGPLAMFCGITIYFFLFLTVLGALILRFRQPNLPRPYKPLILSPIIFCIISFILVLRGLIFAPIQGVILGLLLGVGSLVHLYKSKQSLFSRDRT